jgi:hypothetical protein
MAQCPNCHSEVKADERFCGNCGARIAQSIPPPPVSAPPGNQPPQPTGKETIVLPKITDLGMQPPAPPTPPADATIIATPAPTYQPPIAPTMIGSTPSVPPPPTQPAPLYAGGDYSGAGLPPGATVPPAAKSGSNVWKIVGVIVGIVVLLCVALSIGAYILVQRASTIAQNTLATANASLSDGTFATVGAGFQTAAAGSDLALATLEADATAEPAATRTPKPSTGAGAAATLYSDNFDDEQSSDFTAETNESSVYKFVDGAYQITVTKPKLLSWATMRGDYGDAAITVDASIDGPPASAAGLIFHYQDDKNFYIYSVDGEGRYELDVYKNDKPITLIEWTESAAIKPAGERNSLRVETSGDTIRLYVNDTLLDEVSDSTIANGKAALVVNTFDDANVTVTFDNLVVRDVK